MRKKKSRNDEELNFWQPTSDMLTALLLMVMLVSLLLGLYLVQIPEFSERYPEEGDSYSGWDEEYRNVTVTPTPSPTPTAFFWFPDGGGGGFGGAEETPHPTYFDAPWASPSPTPTISPTPDLPGGGSAGGGGGSGGGEGAGDGPGEQPDMGLKSAVYVMMVDGETDRTVKEAGIQFELYGDGGDALQILNIYYPERLSYRLFETTESGTFYFPEKLKLDRYELHALTEPDGYDAPENVVFDLDGTYDWPDPMVVKVPIYPSRNVVRVQMRDVETGMPVGGGTFDLVADENVITTDGTLRYRIGQVVGEIVCDENGYGVSDEVYLGNYLLRQKEIPPYYAGVEETLAVKVDKRSDVQPELNVITCARTRIHVSLSDELYPTRGIAGVNFEITEDSGRSEPLEVLTDASGRISLNEVQKGTTYRIRQLDGLENYHYDSRQFTVQVTADGRIGGETETSVALTNRMIRTQIGITDEFTNVQVPGVNLALYTQNNELVRSWTSNSSPLLFNDLEPGSYYLVTSGQTEMRHSIYVQDVAEVQSINVHTTYMMQYLIIGLAALMVILLAVVTTVLVVRRKQKKKLKDQEAEEE